MIVDTPQFQRLRDIKQLGTVYFVYPGAAHNRFEHSLGVCHLAGQFARALRESQPELGITDVDILCVEIAGLCRDLGHGPFSRLYINKFLPAVDKNKKYRKPSAKMFEHLVNDNKLKEKLAAYGILEQDRKFIKEQLEGTKPTGSTIVVNNRNGIDVYKWDYLARDCHQLGIKNNFDASRYMKFARVIETEGEMQICIRDKEISNLYNMFYTRYTVNKFAYFHKVTCGIELMIVAALKKANTHVKFKGENNKDCSIYDCYKDMKAFTQLTDNVLFIIRNTETEDKEPTDPAKKQRWRDLRDAKQILTNIFKRELYTCVYESPPMELNDLPHSNKTDAKLEDHEEAILNGIIEKKDIKKEDVIVKVINLHFGMKEENPVERLKVYSKRSQNEARHLKKEEASRILGPVKFYEVLVRVYSTTGKNVELIIKRAKEIIEPKKYSHPTQDRSKKKQDLRPTDTDGIPPVKKSCSQS
ncbi:SAM domain and HD [Bulinus truncatus]|nr:SAM domain and HD [Bulinus truncatus]